MAPVKKRKLPVRVIVIPVVKLIRIVVRRGIMETAQHARRARRVAHPVRVRQRLAGVVQHHLATPRAAEAITQSVVPVKKIPQCCGIFKFIFPNMGRLHIRHAMARIVPQRFPLRCVFFRQIQLPHLRRIQISFRREPA